MSATTTVFVVDRDDSVRRALCRLMEATRFETVCLDSMDALLAHSLPTSNAVIVADVQTVCEPTELLPACLHGKVTQLPIIYITDYDTSPTRQEARRLGAAGYFRRPLDRQALVDAINFAATRANDTRS